MLDASLRAPNVFLPSWEGMFRDRGAFRDPSGQVGSQVKTDTKECLQQVLSPLFFLLPIVHGKGNIDAGRKAKVIVACPTCPECYLRVCAPADSVLACIRPPPPSRRPGEAGPEL